MIVTFDSSILVRATGRSKGPARRLIDSLAKNPVHIIALSPFILGEVGKVLSYPHMQELFSLSADEIHDHVNYLRSISRIVDPPRGLPVVLSDPMTMPCCIRPWLPEPTCCASGTAISMTRTFWLSATAKTLTLWMSWALSSFSAMGKRSTADLGNFG